MDTILRRKAAYLMVTQIEEYAVYSVSGIGLNR